jgi:RNA polymerase sigma-70 factor (ECF subfamily)
VTPDEELALISTIRSNEPWRFDELVSLHQGKLFGFLVGMMRNRQDAEEITQEAFLSAYRNLSRFEGRSSFYTWLRRIAYNLAIDLQRRHRTAEKANPHWIAQSLAESDDGPDDSLMHAEINDIVRGALDRIGADARSILLMRDMQSLDYGEIAEILDVPIGTVRSRLHRARNELRALLLHEHRELFQSTSDRDPLTKEARG